MKIKFRIDYIASPGEELAITNDSVTVAMHCNEDGRTWECITDEVEGDYSYIVVREGKTVRHEWRMARHRLAAAQDTATACTVTDMWIDAPQDAFFYSQAFTHCVARRQSVAVRPSNGSMTLQLKVRAPQLTADQRLALVGNVPQLGNWTALKSVPMYEHQPCEWVVNLDADTMPGWFLEYKFIIIGSDGKPVWENGNNRCLTVPPMREGETVSMELVAARFPVNPVRLAGVVVPVFSLRSEGSWGVGDLGDLQAMITWAHSTGMHAVQILPVNDTTCTGTWQDSYPYNSVSVHALHPQYIDMRQLPKLKDANRRRHYSRLRKRLNDKAMVDYEAVNAAKRAYLDELYAQEGDRILAMTEFRKFLNDNRDWLEPYAQFAVRHNGGKDATEVYYIQYLLHRQLQDVHNHARSLGVILKGDIPIGVSRVSADVASQPQYFNLNGQAGAPPDAFAVEGQNWGFPTYNWEAMKTDGYKWWKRRLEHMSQYFDAYRIDHVLGFFRIWEVPGDAVQGLLGQFSPALALTADEITRWGLEFDARSMTVPHITDETIKDMPDGIRDYLTSVGKGQYALKEGYRTQVQIKEAVADDEMRQALYALTADVLFLRDHHDPDLFHPRVSARETSAYKALGTEQQTAFDRLSDDYFYRRNEEYWRGVAMERLPRVVEATGMLACAEDLGMVPACVQQVMDALGILTLEIQTMPKAPYVRFANLNTNPYRSVATIFTHDMPTLRQWWDEDRERAQAYYNTVLWRDGKAIHPMTAELAASVVAQHLNSPSMLCLLSLQDWLATDDTLRNPDANAERINIPANPRHYWRWRMHITLEQLQSATGFNERLAAMISTSGRK